MLNVGDKAPDFSLHINKTDKVALADLRGKKAVLAFFPAAFTGVCEKELCTFRDSMSELNGLDAKVVGISVDGPFANMAFADKNKLTFPIVSDYARQAVKAYGVALDDFAGLPGYTAAKRAVFVLDREGIVRYAWAGPNPGVEPDYEEVKRAVAAA